MLTLTNRAAEEIRAGIASGQIASDVIRVSIDHRCHCGKAHFSLALAERPLLQDATLEVGGVQFVADSETSPELSDVEIDYVETAWNRGLVIRNRRHQCGGHMAGH